MEGRVALFFRGGAHGPGVIFWIFFFDAKHKLNTVIDCRTELVWWAYMNEGDGGTWLVLFVVQELYRYSKRSSMVGGNLNHASEGTP